MSPAAEVSLGSRAGVPWRNLLRSSAVVGVALGLAYGLNALLNLLLARLLGPTEYSLLAPLLVVVMVATVPAIGLQSAVAREVARHLDEGGAEQAGRVVREAVSEVVRWQIGLLAAVALLGYPLALLLHVRDALAVVATALAIVASLALQPLWGALQGAHRFGRFSASQVAYSLVKLALALVLGWIAGVGGVMVGIALAGFGTLALLFWWLNDLRRAATRLAVRRRRLLTRYSGSAALVLTLFAVVSNVDVVVARLSTGLGHHLAGLYSAASMSSRLIMTASAAAVTVLFPRVSVLRDRARERAHLRAGTLAVALLGLVAVAIAFAFGEQLVRLVFGGDFSDSAAWLGPLCVAMTLYAVGSVYVYHFLSLARGRLPILLGAVTALELAGFALFHSSPRQLVVMQIAAAGLLVAACELFERLRPKEAAS
jgi:O-antigen/teichoic acid export membrane protein